MSAPEPVAIAELCTSQCELTVEPTAPPPEPSAPAAETSAGAAEACAGAAETCAGATSDNGTSSADAAPKVMIKAIRSRRIMVHLPSLAMSRRANLRACSATRGGPPAGGSPSRDGAVTTRTSRRLDTAVVALRSYLDDA